MVKDIYLEDIALGDERFRISFFFSLERLKQSLKAVGMTHPPVVVRRRGKIVLVTGWKRVLAAKELSFSGIPVVFSDEKDDLRTFLLAVHENLIERNLSLLEKTEIIAKLVFFGLNKERLLREYCPLIELPATAYYLNIYQKISALGLETKRFIQENRVPLPVAEKLLRFTAPERKKLIPLLAVMGQNKQKIFLEEMHELLQRENTDLDHLMHRDPLNKVMSDENMSQLQKADRMRQVIHRMRYPVLSEWNEALERYLKQMDRPEEIPLSASPFFEDDRFTIPLSFRTPKELEDLLSKLKKLAESAELKKMTDRFQDE